MKTWAWIVCAALAGCGPVGSGPVNVEQPTSAAEACSRIGNPALVLSTWHVCSPTGGARCFVGTGPREPTLECRPYIPGAQAFCQSAGTPVGEPLTSCPEGVAQCPAAWSCRPYVLNGRTISACFPPSCSGQSDAGVSG